ncbi:CBS domain-containing protein [Uliginosibacterium aquaticum]|uniref:CBS domain-containing protein n=1 Tax=Uliginosibacterium aquaticum TaxID=2731212 RepID=A0ABX2IFN0_9RHOO|nr:CBS domain-containing protein [Uliginosibacterium aquaticum]NSL55012.1 CBS domain-containing protein [Uliginosibacterium aquaticum]
MLLSDVLAIKGKTLYTISPQKTLADALALMSEQDVGSLVVIERGALVGILTFREALAAINAAGALWQGVSVADAMLRDPAVGDPRMDLYELRTHLVDHHQRYLPVVESGVLQGLVSFHDVARAVLEEQGFESLILRNFVRNWPDEVLPIGKPSTHCSDR